MNRRDLNREFVPTYLQKMNEVWKFHNSDASIGALSIVDSEEEEEEKKDQSMASVSHADRTQDLPSLVGNEVELLPGTVPVDDITMRDENAADTPIN